MSGGGRTVSCMQLVSYAGEAQKKRYSSTCPKVNQQIFMYNPVTFQTAASVLGLKPFDIAH